MAKSRREFDDYGYNPSYESTVERAERKGSLYDALFKGVKVFTPKQGNNLVRILWPTWKNHGGHFGLRVKVHYDIGPENRRYLCLKDEHSPHKRCPVCEALYDLGPRASNEEKRALRAGDGIVYYLLDRDNEKEGVQVWMTSPSNDAEIAAQMTDPRKKSVINIVHPENGYDIEFNRSGQGKTGTRYRGFKILREESPLSDSDRVWDDVLDFITDHPLPTVLNFYSPEYIEGVFYGRAQDEDEDRSSRRRRARDEDEDDEVEDKPRSRKARDEEEDEPEESRSRSDQDPDPDPSRLDEEEEEPRPRRRTKTEEELDDNLPSEGRRRAKPNGRDEEDNRSNRARRAERPSRDADTDADEDRTTRRSSRRSEPEPEEEEQPRARRARRDPDEDEDELKNANDERKRRVRERLDRS